MGSSYSLIAVPSIQQYLCLSSSEVMTSDGAIKAGGHQVFIILELHGVDRTSSAWLKTNKNMER